MILVADTETTGMIRWNDPPDAPTQPHIIQLGAALYRPDGTELSAVSLLVNSVAAVEPEAQAIHGIDDSALRLAGISPKLAMHLLARMAVSATTLVCHNVSFDRKMLHIEFLRTGIDWSALGDLPTYCTMQASTPLCRLLKLNPRYSADYKWPKLGEAYAHFFDEPLIGAHDALRDVRACARIYFHLNREHGAPSAP